jgi:anaerobic magnesium-protoporphyrin IX monomethyl ester cyclase
LNESNAREQAERLIPLGMRWWAEGRIDTVLRYSDATWLAIRRSGATMIFFGAESGSDEVLVQMNKTITTTQTLDLAARIREFGIIPEFSFVVGSPQNPERDTRDTIDFIRRLKRLNPDAEIIVQHYIPTPHPARLNFRPCPRNGRVSDGTTSLLARIRIFRGCRGE